MATKKTESKSDKKPVYAIAKDLGISSKELIAKIAEWDLGWTVSNHANRLTAEQQEQVAAKLKPKRTRKTKAKPAETAGEKKATAKKTTAKKATSKKTTTKKSTAKKEAAPAEEKAEPKKKSTRKSSTKKAEAADTAKEKVEAAAEKKPRRTRSRSKKAESTDAAEEKVEAKTETKPKAKRSRRSRSKQDEGTQASETVEETVTVDGAAESKAYLNKVFKAMGIRLPRLEANEDNDRVYVNLNGFGNEALLGQANAAARTDVIEALQTLTGKAVYPSGPSKQVILDVGGFREDREGKLAETAKRVAAYVRASGKALRFAAMNSFDRRAFHANLKSEEDVRSESEGDGVFRRLRVQPTKS